VFIDKSGVEGSVIDGLPHTGGSQPPAALKRFLDDLGRERLARHDQMDRARSAGCVVLADPRKDSDQ
jgi:hypothetical protein